jgi:hypothetical protein
VESESMRRELEADKDSQDKKELEIARTRIRQNFFAFPFDLDSEAELEIRVVQLIEELRDDILEKGNVLLDLILYLYAVESISFETCLTLIGYSAFRHRRTFQNKIRYKTEDLTKNSFAAIVSGPLFSGAGFLLSSLSFVGIFFMFTRLLDFCAKDRVQCHNGYGHFKADFQTFLVKEHRNMRKLLGI